MLQKPEKVNKEAVFQMTKSDVHFLLCPMGLEHESNRIIVSNLHSMCNLFPPLGSICAEKSSSIQVGDGEGQLVGE